MEPTHTLYHARGYGANKFRCLVERVSRIAMRVGLDDLEPSKLYRLRNTRIRMDIFMWCFPQWQETFLAASPVPSTIASLSTLGLRLCCLMFSGVPGQSGSIWEIQIDPDRPGTPLLVVFQASRDPSNC